jgi:hypothetical protein
LSIEAEDLPLDPPEFDDDVTLPYLDDDQDQDEVEPTDSLVVGAVRTASATEALAWMTAQSLHPTMNLLGKCQKAVRLSWRVPSLYGSAAIQASHARHLHPDVDDAPLGAPLVWSGGSHGYGHISDNAGHGRTLSTDVRRSGKVDIVRISSISENWGLKLLGWIGDLNGVDLPLTPLGADSYDSKRVPSATGGSGLLAGESYTVGDVGSAVAAINAFLHLGGATYSPVTARSVRAWQLLANEGGSRLRVDGRVDTLTYHAMGRAAARRSHK